MANMFNSATSFNADLSKWDVSSVTDMDAMFYCASLFDGDLSKWDVSRLQSAKLMFKWASSFKQALCGAWLKSKADKDGMFTGSPGRICRKRSAWSPETNEELRDSV